MLISVHKQCGIILTRVCAKTVWVSPACTHSSSPRYRRLAWVSNELKQVLIFIYILNYGCNTSECLNRRSAKGTGASLDWGRHTCNSHNDMERVLHEKYHFSCWPLWPCWVHGVLLLVPYSHMSHFTKRTNASRPKIVPWGPYKTNSWFGIVATLLHVQTCYSLPSAAIKLFTHFADSGGLRDAHW
jgi:hypothetical protein